jgi:hypothetical protein
VRETVMDAAKAIGMDRNAASVSHARETPVGVTWLSVLLIAACLVSLACQDDPARSVKIIDRPARLESAAAPPSPNPAKAAAVPPKQPFPVAATPRRPMRLAAAPSAPVSSTVTPAQSPEANWIPEFCPPPADESPGPGDLIVSGPCGLRHRAAVHCESSRDDFITAFTQNARNGATIVTYVNVEFYHGPGSYDGAQVFVAVQSATSIYRWSNDNAHAVVGPDEAFVLLPETRLMAEPMLVDCSRLIGPATNYQYQCARSTDAKMVVSSPPEVLSGRLQCGLGK